MILPFLAQIPFISSLENVGVHGCSEAEAGTTYISHISSVQFSSVTYDSATPWTATHQASLSITNSRSLLKLMSIELVMPSNHLICRPLLLPSIFPSIRVFSKESTQGLNSRLLCLLHWQTNSLQPGKPKTQLLYFKIQFPLGLLW